jgi:oxygen-independent coproporphyrinogen-3 oxidase
MANTLARIKQLDPESITVHSLAIKRAARLKGRLDELGETIHHDMNTMLDMVEEAAGTLGMEPYYMYRQKNIGGNLENVGYSKNGKECLYNILIMEEITDIIAAGAGGSTKLVYPEENRVERVENCKSVDDYISRFDEMLDRKSGV